MNTPNLSGAKLITLNTNEIQFYNSSQEKALDTNKLLERFSKNNPSKEGKGLGLSIVNKISEQNNWKIEYQFENSLHYFVLKF